MIDWRLAGTVAQFVSAGNAAPAGGAAAFEALAEPVAESQRLISAYTGLKAAEPVPAPEAVDRATWIETNLASMRGLLDPASSNVGGGFGPAAIPLRAAGGAVLAVEVGVVSGYLAQRVLGQYEFPVLDASSPARLLFVAPNLARATQTLEADADDLLRWVALHETTHALQFGAVPWLRPHLARKVQELLTGMRVSVDAKKLLRLPDASDLRGLVDAVRSGGLATLVLGPGRQGVIEEMQGFMAVLEGYAEHVMDAVGAELLPDLGRLRGAMDRRRRDRSGLLRLLERLIGLDLKLRQYEQGKAFCDGVVARGGIAALNRVWYAPDKMPTVAELDDPVGWLARTEPLRLAPGDAG